MLDIRVELRVTDRLFFSDYLPASVNNSEESSLDQPGEYLWKLIILQRDSGKHREQIPRKPSVVVNSWVHPVLCSVERERAKGVWGLEGMLQVCAGLQTLLLSHHKKLRKNGTKMLNVISEKEKLETILCSSSTVSEKHRIQSGDVIIMSSFELTHPPSVHIYHNLFQFNAISHFSSVAVTSNGTSFPQPVLAKTKKWKIAKV